LLQNNPSMQLDIKDALFVLHILLHLKVDVLAVE